MADTVFEVLKRNLAERGLGQVKAGYRLFDHFEVRYHNDVRFSTYDRNVLGDPRKPHLNSLFLFFSNTLTPNDLVYKSHLTDHPLMSAEMPEHIPRFLGDMPGGEALLVSANYSGKGWEFEVDPTNMRVEKDRPLPKDITKILEDLGCIVDTASMELTG